MSSTKFVFFRPIQKTRWPSWPLIGWDIFDPSSPRQHAYVGPTLGQRCSLCWANVGFQCWANVGFQCWANVVSAKCPNVGPTCWRNVGPTSEYLQNYVGPTLAPVTIMVGIMLGQCWQRFLFMVHFCIDTLKVLKRLDQLRYILVVVFFSVALNRPRISVLLNPKRQRILFKKK